MQFGRLWLVRLAVGVVLGAVIFFYSRRPSRIGARPAVALWLILGLSFLLLISLAWAGHAVAGIHDRVLHLGVDALHLVTGAVWPVGLVPLSLFLREANRREEDLSGDGQHESLERFSQVSFVAVLVLVVTGTINGCLMIGSWRALFTTPYGELLLGKVAIAGIMIGLGAFNRLRLLPRMGETSGALRTLRGTVLAESVLAAAVLLIVGMMGMTSPPS
jgi:putative copper resistance protein D